MLKAESVVDAPPRPIFMLLANLEMRPWFDHGVGWKVEKVEITSQAKKGVGVVSRWRGDYGGSAWEKEFVTTEWEENMGLTLESRPPVLAIKHLLAQVSDRQTRLTVIKEFYGEVPEGEEERLATLVDNVRVLFSRKPSPR